MDKNVIKGNWNLVKGKIKEQWGKLTDDDLQEIDGKKDQLLGKLQKKYGYNKERAEKELSDFTECHCKEEEHDENEKFHKSKK